MNQQKLNKQIEDLTNATKRLQEVLDLPLTEIIRDSAIKRFELVMDLAWKTLKTFLLVKHGITIKSPKQAFREAYSIGVIPYDTVWFKLIDARNETVHTYNEFYAQTIYKLLPTALEHMNTLLTAIKNEQSED